MHVHLAYSSEYTNTSGVPPIYGVTQNGSGQYLMVMQLAENGTLDNSPHDSPRFSNWNQILDTARWLADSLYRIHLQDCIHYDLHPGNVAFRFDNYVTLLDV